MLEVSFSEVSKKVEFFPWRRLNFFFLLVSALIRLAQWLVWALYRVRFVPSFCLFVCFSSDGQGWVRWYSCLLMIGFVFLFCLLFRWDVLHRMLLVVGWCRVLYSSGFLCVSSHTKCEFPLYVTCRFFLAAFNILSFCLVFVRFISMWVFETP